jgi:hypothetical protein
MVNIAHLFTLPRRGTSLANLRVMNSIIPAIDTASDKSSLLPLQQVSNGESRQLRRRTITAAIIFPVSIILTAVAAILPASSSAATRCDITSTAIDDQGSIASTSPLISSFAVLSPRFSICSCPRGSLTNARWPAWDGITTSGDCALSVPPCRDGDPFPFGAVEVFDRSGSVV